MRICLFTPTFLPRVGGAERDADVLARSLMARGHDVRVLAGKGPGPAPELPYPVTWYRRPPLQHLVTEWLSRPLMKLYRRWPFDVVLAFYGYPTGYAASLARERLEKQGKGRVALVVTPRGADLYPNYHDLRKLRVERLIAEGYGRADRIVSISHWLSGRLREVHEQWGGEGKEELPPVDLVYNGIDLEAHDRQLAAARQNPPEVKVDLPFVLHLARVAPVKQQILAIEAVRRLRGVFEQQGLRYAVVGEGQDLPRVRAMVEKYELSHVVKLLGTRSGLEKAWLLDQARFMVSTSREEGLGNVVIEAMASGLPMLGSDIGPHRELIGEGGEIGGGKACSQAVSAEQERGEGGGWGMLFRSGDADDLAAKMEAMISADLAPLRRQALQQREFFTLDAMIDGYERACELAVEGRREGRNSNFEARISNQDHNRQ